MCHTLLYVYVSSHLDDDRGDIEACSSFNNRLVGRDHEITRVREFCSTFSKKKLLVVFGLPGTGKSYLMNHVIPIVLKENPHIEYYAQRFPAVFGDPKLNLETLAAIMCRKINGGICDTGQEVAGLCELLMKISKPTVILLEMGYMTVFGREVKKFWSLIFKVLQRQNNLKIIVTCSKKPDISQAYFDVEVLHLTELDSESVIHLLQQLNPGLSLEHCVIIAPYCCRNPSLICKMGTLVKSFSCYEGGIRELIMGLVNISKQDNVNILINQTVLELNLKVLFENLNKDEQRALVQLSCFYDEIPVAIVDLAFGSRVKYYSHCLYAAHGLLKRRDVETYHMSELLRRFIQHYCKANNEFDELLHFSKKQLIKFYTQYLWFLDEVFFVPSKLDGTSQIKEKAEQFKSRCEKCKKGKCKCPIPLITQLILQKYKTSLFYHLLAGLQNDCTVIDVIDTCCKAAHFLRKSLPYDELRIYFEVILKKAQLKNDTLRLATILSNLVYIKSYRRQEDEIEEDIKILTNSIDLLETLPAQKELFLETLANSYINRGHLKGLYSCQFEGSISDIEKGRKILSKLKQDGNFKMEILDLESQGHAAGRIFYD